ncbi:MAG TPA: adenosylmethionine decarboxylase [Candidatus Woesearchaeota archaeon]|nr:adenosylmethionine decarboxylase [Candidatus Woesearchaeota archaeon]
MKMIHQINNTDTSTENTVQKPFQSSNKPDLGYHFLASFYGCDPQTLDNPELLLKIIHGAARYAEMTPFGDLEKKFFPQGASAILGLEESHISIHTWPEYGVATLDVYTCGTKESCEKAYDMLKMRFRPEKIKNEYFIER